jgi:ABC-type cobalamin/Fe3+-siderophores transport system ATPase subunit
VPSLEARSTAWLTESAITTILERCGIVRYRERRIQEGNGGKKSKELSNRGAES